MPARVFVVEDDEIIAGLIRQILAARGYRVAGSAASGEEALERIPAVPCDVILMDIGLAGDADGITVARILSTRVRIPVIFVTAQFDDQILERAKTPNTCGYLIKPFTANDLCSNIEIALFSHRLRADPGRDAVPAPASAGTALPEAPPRPAPAPSVPAPIYAHVMKGELKQLYDHGYFYQSKGNYPRALQYFIEILEHDPGDAAIWVEKGDVLWNLGRAPEALDAIDAGLRLDPASEYALCKKSRILCSTGRQADALGVIETALGVTRDNRALLVEKGLVLHELGRNEDAIRVLDHAIGIDKNSGYALGAKGRVLGNLGKNREALAAFGTALAIEPKNVSLWMDLIRVFEQKKNYHTALNVLQIAIEKNPENQVLTMKRDTLLHRTIPVA